MEDRAYVPQKLKEHPHRVNYKQNSSLLIGELKSKLSLLIQPHADLSAPRKAERLWIAWT